MPKRVTKTEVLAIKRCAQTSRSARPTLRANCPRLDLANRIGSQPISVTARAAASLRPLRVERLRLRVQHPTRQLDAFSSDRLTTCVRRLKRVLKIDILTYRHVGGAVNVSGSIEDPAVMKKILDPLVARGLVGNLRLALVSSGRRNMFPSSVVRRKGPLVTGEVGEWRRLAEAASRAMTNRQDCRFGRPQVARRVAHREVRHQIHRLKHHVRHAISVPRLQAVANIPAGSERQALSRERRGRDVAAQAFQLLPLVCFARHPGMQPESGSCLGILYALHIYLIACTTRRPARDRPNEFDHYAPHN